MSAPGNKMVQDIQNRTKAAEAALQSCKAEKEALRQRAEAAEAELQQCKEDLGRVRANRTAPITDLDNRAKAAEEGLRRCEENLQQLLTSGTSDPTTLHGGILSAYLDMARSNVANSQVLINKVESMANCSGCEQSNDCKKRKRCDVCPAGGNLAAVQDLNKQLGEEIAPPAGLVANIRALLTSLNARIFAPRSTSDPQGTTMGDTNIPTPQEIIQTTQSFIQDGQVVLDRIQELESELQTLRANAPGAGGGDDDCPKKLEEANKRLKFYEERRIPELEAELDRLKAHASGAPGGDDDCPKKLEEARKELKEARDYLQKEYKNYDLLQESIEESEEKLEIQIARLKTELSRGDLQMWRTRSEKYYQELQECLGNADQLKRQIDFARNQSMMANFKEIQTCKKHAEQLKKELEEVRKELTETQARLQIQEIESQELDYTNDELLAEIRSLKADLARQPQTPADVATLKKKLEECEEHKEKLQKLLKDAAKTNDTLDDSDDPKDPGDSDDLEKCKKAKDELEKELKKKDEQLETLRKLVVYEDFAMPDKNREVKALKDEIAGLKHQVGASKEKYDAAINLLLARIAQRDKDIKELEQAQQGVVAPPAGNEKALQTEIARLEAVLKQAESAQRTANGLRNKAETDLALANGRLQKEEKLRKACDEKFGILLQEERERKEAERIERERRRAEAAGGPRPPPTPNTPGNAGSPDPGADDSMPPPEDDRNMDDGAGPEYAGEIEDLNNQIEALKQQIANLEQAAVNDQLEKDALRDNSNCNKKLTAHIDRLRAATGELQRRLKDCQNETWQERRRRMRLAAAANRRPPGTLPPNPNRRLDPALRQRQEWRDNRWWGEEPGDADDAGDEEPLAKRLRTRKPKPKK
ncbi:hypothetical protein L207DRAFT_638714 [Hyaloscypha variabilis F]|uniref:Uncharacterized protein n=1 Tax=Hyaloscypha variabilis (strain UAMH 11265 / GT02V1 / F) TaxID=1149755 RepID=A0A2J6R6M6_HYAVF|nr:hypothetical protein L207DRAFT_638714 [Hyaloscypha variabilis F]